MLNNKILLELAFLKEHLFVLLDMCIGRAAHQAGLWMGAGRGDTYCIHHGPSWVWLGWGGCGAFLFCILTKALAKLTPKQTFRWNQDIATCEL